MEKGEVTISSDWIEVPYEYTYSGHIKIMVDVAGKNYPFILDSGAGNILFGDDHSLSNGLKWVGFGMDSNGSLFFTKIKGLDRFRIGELSGKDLRFKIQRYPLDCPEEFIGIIGKETMRHFVWQFFPERKMIRIARSQNETIHYPDEDTISLSRNKNSHHLYVSLGLENRKRKSYIVDTGSNSTISTPIDSTWQKDRGKRVFGLASKGLSSIDTTGSYLFKIDTLIFKNGYKIMAPISINVRNNDFKALGTGFLKNFNFTIDWQTNQLILSPLENQTFIGRGFGAGIDIDDDKGVYISSIIEDSPAYRASFAVNQKIASVNGVNASSIDGCLLEEIKDESDTLKLTFIKEDKLDSVGLIKDFYVK